jgi:hypothetical protein
VGVPNRHCNRRLGDELLAAILAVVAELGDLT